jgi:hypothetical protein
VLLEASGGTLMRSAGVAEEDLPAAVVNDTVLRRATPGTVAEALGLTYRRGAGTPDLVVVGAAFQQVEGRGAAVQRSHAHHRGELPQSGQLQFHETGRPGDQGGGP